MEGTTADTTHFRCYQPNQCPLSSADTGAATAADVGVAAGNSALYPHAVGVPHTKVVISLVRGASILLLLLLWPGASILPPLLLLRPGALVVSLLLLRPGASMLSLLLLLGRRRPGAFILPLLLL